MEAFFPYQRDAEGFQAYSLESCSHGAGAAVRCWVARAVCTGRCARAVCVAAVCTRWCACAGVHAHVNSDAGGVARCDNENSFRGGGGYLLELLLQLSLQILRAFTTPVSSGTPGVNIVTLELLISLSRVNNFTLE